MYNVFLYGNDNHRELHGRTHSFHARRASDLPGPVPTSAFFSAANCLRIAPLAASTITSGLVGEPPRAESAKNETSHAMCARPSSPTKTTCRDFSAQIGRSHV